MIALLLALAFAQDRDDPETERAAFKVAEGYEVALFASEKEGVVKPLQIRWDARGRLWVTCGPSYPQLRPGEQEDDTILILEDSDGDGRADRSRVFARGLSTPMGLELGRGGAFVGSGGELFHLKDTGSDRPPEKSVLLKGFFTGDSHQNINSFVWSPGGDLFFCQGLHATSRVETPWGVEKLEKAGFWRLNDRTLKLDPFLGYDMGPQNPYGIVFDDWGQPIMVSGNGQGVWYPLPAMIRTTHFLPYAQIWDKTNKLAGADFLSGPHWPDEMQGLMVSGVYLNNAFYAFRILEDGAGFRAVNLPPIIVSSHSSFRPVDVRVGPDGAIYVADWYNPIIGHYQASFRHPDRDKTHGRIWRITAKGRPPAKAPNLVAMATPELLEQMKAPERWVRYQAKRLLAEKDPAELQAALVRWTAGADDRVLLEALQLYETLDVVEPGLLKKLLRSREPRIRAYAAGTVGRWQDRLPDRLDLLSEAVADEHPRVRLAAVVSASGVPDPRAIEVAAMAADRAMDRFITYALTQAVHALKPHWKPAFDAGQLTFGNKAERIQFVLKADGTQDVLRALQTLLKREDLSREVRDNALVLLAATGGPDELAAVLKEVDPSTPLGSRILEEAAGSFRRRRIVPSGDWNGALHAWVKGPLKPQALTLAGLWKVEALRPEIEGAEAFEALADLGGTASAAHLAEKARGGSSAAVRALLRLDVKGAAAAAAAILTGGKGDIEDLVTAFLSRQGGTELLAEALAGKSLPADAAKLGLRALSSAGRQDAPLRDLLLKAAGITSAAPEYNLDFVKELGREALAEGDPVRGEGVFRGTLTNCFSCHAIGGAGGKVGPDLSAVGTGLPVDMLIESVLWPNRQVKEGYTATAVLTRNEEIFQGLRVNEDKQTLILRDPNREALIRIPIADIKARKEIGSVMPEGLANGLTRTELRDLIRFLAELGKPGAFRVSDRPLVRRWMLTDGAGRATQKFSTVSGDLPREDLGASREVSFEVEVLREGRFRLAVTPDGGPSAVDLPKGRRWITLKVNPAAGPLRCEVTPDSGSAGELRLPN